MFFRSSVLSSIAMSILSWFSFIQPASEPIVYQSFLGISAFLIFLGLLLPLYFKRKSNRWMLEWSREVRLSALTYGVIGLILAWLSSQNVVVLGARVWYVLLTILILWRGYSLWNRRKFWSMKEKDEARRLQQLKYIPSRARQAR